MFFFKKPIVSRERQKVLEDFRDSAVRALRELKKNAPTELERELFSRMTANVLDTPIRFYPRKTLKEKILFTGNRIISSVVRGEHVNVIKIYQKGDQRFFVKSNYINLPSEHVFEENKLSVDGIFTLAHEYAHFPKPSLGKFARANNISYEQAEELLADTLSAKLAVSMGYPKQLVLRHFQGRELVYGKIPFKRLIWNAVNK